MHYPIDAGLIVTPQQYQNQPLIPKDGLSEMDIQEVRKFYPGEDKDQVLELEPFLSKLVTIFPGDQIDFLIRPNVSRRYTIQTFGDLDTVIVLFEDVIGNPVFQAGDDDSGTNRNAQIQIRLLRDRKYYLRLRLYYPGDTGYGVVMLW